MKPFTNTGDFLQRIQAIWWAVSQGALLIAVIVAKLSGKTTALVVVVLSLIFVALIVPEILYIARLRSQRDEALLQKEKAIQAVIDERVKNRAWRALVQRGRSVDEIIGQTAQYRLNREPAAKRGLAIEKVLIALRDDLLPGIDVQNKRVAFLEFSEITKKFRVSAWTKPHDPPHILAIT